MTYPVSELTTPSRYPQRATYEREAAHDVLDSAFVCHVGFVLDGAPRVLPTLFVRVGETVYLHGSTAATPWLAARRDGGLPIVVETTLTDALVLARSQFHHSANYRSVVAHGTGRLVTDEAAKRAAMAALVDKVGSILAAAALAPGPAATAAPSVDMAAADLRRSTHSRPPTPAELAKTAVIALDLVDVSVKRRTGQVGDDEADLALPYWAGIVPLYTTVGVAEPADGVTVSPPPYLTVVAAAAATPSAPAPKRSAWLDGAQLTGRHVRIEPLTAADGPELFAALDDSESWPHMTVPQPTGPDDWIALAEAAVADPDRLAWLQRDVATGEVIGTTSYYGVNEVTERLVIGWTMVARSRWRTAVNTETKLLLLTRAFDTLGAGRVEFQVDSRNERSQRAVERLGATREGVLRRHKKRGDGTWRDSVIFSIIVDDWPTVRNGLSSRLAAGQTEARARHH
jgi:RimJ/RimL family protein N-acetyltransferase/nitroimidazol reductase NimA-like FMN-containing flavoprotein (pyridoxamine 5'-phosphate oxidase superfamily)